MIRYFSLRGEHAPTRIPDRQLEQFRFMLDFSENTVNFNRDELIPGQQVRVIKGPLTGLEGELITVEGKSDLVVRIQQLGCATVEINAGMVEVIGK